VDRSQLTHYRDIRRLVATYSCQKLYLSASGISRLPDLLVILPNEAEVGLVLGELQLGWLTVLYVSPRSVNFYSSVTGKSLNKVKLAPTGRSYPTHSELQFRSSKYCHPISSKCSRHGRDSTQWSCRCSAGRNVSRRAAARRCLYRDMRGTGRIGPIVLKFLHFCSAPKQIGISLVTHWGANESSAQAIKTSVQGAHDIPSRNILNALSALADEAGSLPKLLTESLL
jgi:hypothetical protein